MATKQEKYAKGLIALGFVEQGSPSSKYRLFYKEGSSAAFFFLGKSGAVRFNAFRRITGAVAASEATKKAILNRAAQQNVGASSQPPSN